MPLTPEEQRELRRDLVTGASEIDQSLTATQQAAKPVELDQASVGRVSRIDAIQQQKMVEATRRALSARRQQIQAALRRFEEEEYGDCLDCGEAIPFARLKAKPESLFCVRCQENRERR
jgi:DnaK suppressor protein